MWNRPKSILIILSESRPMSSIVSIPPHPLDLDEVQNRRAFLKREKARMRHYILAQSAIEAELRLLDREPGNCATAIETPEWCI